MQSRGPQEAIQIAKKTQHKYFKHQETMVEGLVEFQKAQCFFMLAIQITALAVEHGKPF